MGGRASKGQSQAHRQASGGTGLALELSVVSHLCCYGTIFCCMSLTHRRLHRMSSDKCQHVWAPCCEGGLGAHRFHEESRPREGRPGLDDGVWPRPSPHCSRGALCPIPGQQVKADTEDLGGTKEHCSFRGGHPQVSGSQGCRACAGKMWLMGAAEGTEQDRAGHRLSVPRAPRAACSSPSPGVL